MSNGNFKYSADVTLLGADRLTLSINGNPRFVLHTDEGNYRTSSDAAISYDIENHVNSRYDSWVGKRVTLGLTKAGRVIDWKVER